MKQYYTEQPNGLNGFLADEILTSREKQIESIREMKMEALQLLDERKKVDATIMIERALEGAKEIGDENLVQEVNTVYIKIKQNL